MRDRVSTTFGEIFEISSSRRVLQSQWKREGVPFYRAREIVSLAKHGHAENELFISEALFSELTGQGGAPQAGDLMISAVGTLGACYVVKPTDRFYFKDASVLRFSPKQDVCARYFMHAIRSDSIQDQINSGGGSTVGTYTIERARNTAIRIPPLSEQKRIAAILDKADEIRRKRELAISKLDQLARSVFVEIFSNSKFEEKSLGEICDVRDGTHDSPKYVARGYPLITSKNLTSGFIDSTTANHISESDYLAIKKRSGVNHGDILMPMIGTIGNPVLVEDIDPQFAIKNVALIKFRKTSPLAEYVKAVLESPLFLNYIKFISRGGTQKFLSLGDIRRFPVPVPPISMQNEFLQRKRAIKNIQKGYTLSLLKSVDLINSLTRGLIY